MGRGKHLKGDYVRRSVSSTIAVLELFCLIVAYVLANEYHLADELLLAIGGSIVALLLCIATYVKMKAGAGIAVVLSLVLLLLNCISEYAVDCEECYTRGQQVLGKVATIASRANVGFCVILCVASLLYVCKRSKNAEDNE